MSYQRLFARLQRDGFLSWVNELQQMQKNWFCDRYHGDYLRWAVALKMLPEIQSCQADYSSNTVTIQGHCHDKESLISALRLLQPWRKGPYQISEITIDSEWRSDFKWDRVLPHLKSLKGRKVLDVGCGNGYHSWRMLDQDPELVLGIDPSVLFNMQFKAVQHYVRDDRIQLLPLTIQQMPSNMQWFDSVFSMGILYHRKSPFDHLQQLKSLLKPGGELCLETLIIRGEAGQVLVPNSRYARMNNVWFLPSANELAHWLERIGFKNIRVVDINQTSIDEQRSTDWMPFESLAECLDSDDENLTVEGYPAPLRAVMMAEK